MMSSNRITKITRRGKNGRKNGKCGLPRSAKTNTQALEHNECMTGAGAIHIPKININIHNFYTFRGRQAKANSTRTKRPQRNTINVQSFARRHCLGCEMLYVHS